MTRNKKIVIPNITYVGQQQNNSSGQINPIFKLTNLQKAQIALSNKNNPKLSNLEKAKKALEKVNSIKLQATPSGQNPFYEIYKDAFKNINFKVQVNSGKDLEKAKLMQELINYVMYTGLLPKNYDKNTNQSGNSKNSLRPK